MDFNLQQLEKELNLTKKEQEQLKDLSSNDKYFSQFSARKIILTNRIADMFNSNHSKNLIDDVLESAKTYLYRKLYVKESIDYFQQK